MEALLPDPFPSRVPWLVDVKLFDPQADVTIERVGPRMRVPVVPEEVEPVLDLVCDELLEKDWGIQASPTSRTVDNFIVKLRRKLEEDQKNPRHILTVYGLGYKLVP